MLTRAATASLYTAEYNFRWDKLTSVSSSLDAIFAYGDADNYRIVRVNKATMELSLIDRVKGVEEVAATKPLPKGTDLEKVHTIRIESGRSGTLLYWDGLLKIEQAAMAGKAGRIGYAWPQGVKPDLHYTAFSNEANGSSDTQVIKPLPGTLEAVHADFEGNPVIQSGITPDGSDAVVLSKKDDGLNFPVTVREDGSYLLSVSAAKTSEGSTLMIESNGNMKAIKLDAALFADKAEWTKVPLGEFELKAGTQWLSLHGGRVKSRFGMWKQVELYLCLSRPSSSRQLSVWLIDSEGTPVGRITP